MAVRVNIVIERDEATPALKRLNDAALSKDGMEEMHQYAQTKTLNFIRDYHRQMESADGWANKSLPTHGAGRKKSGFGTSIIEAWQYGKVTANGYNVFNGSNNKDGENRPLLAHKITGGTITPKRASWLTIPMVPEAHNTKVANYPGKLFRPKGKDYLMENKDGVARIVYLLKKSVYQKPWPKAMPTDEAIAADVLKSIDEYLDTVIK